MQILTAGPHFVHLPFPLYIIRVEELLELLIIFYYLAVSLWRCSFGFGIIVLYCLVLQSLPEIKQYFPY